MAEISGTGLAASAVGVLFLWSAVKGASISETFRSLLKGEQPTGDTVHGIDVPTAQSTASAGAGVATGAASGAKAAIILSLCASMKGFTYCFGGGHSGNPCSAKCADCSGTVSCILNKAGVMKGSLATGGFASFGTGVPYAQRQPGDLIVWTNGVQGHMGIIIDGSTFWNNPCTGCGGWQIGHYPYGSRTAAAAIIRRP